MVDRRNSISSPVGRAGLDAAILRAALLDDVHAPQALDAAGDGGHHRGGNLVHLVHHAVDAEAHVAGFAPRFEVDVRSALLEGVLEQPVDDVHHVLVVGVELAGARQFDQLLEIGNPPTGPRLHAASAHLSWSAPDCRTPADNAESGRDWQSHAGSHSRSAWANSFSHSRTNGSAVAITTSREPASIGRIMKREA